MPLGNFLFKKVISEVIAHLHNFFMMLTKGDGENPIKFYSIYNEQGFIIMVGVCTTCKLNI